MKKLILLFITTSFVLSQNLIWSVDEKYENGNIKAISYHQKIWQKIGLVKKETYYENGQMASIGNYIDGEEDGKWTYYNEDGIEVAEPILYKNGPTWQNVPDSVNAFQTKHSLIVDGKWGPAPHKKFLKLTSDKKKANAYKARAARVKAAKAKADKAKEGKAKEGISKAMKIYTDEFAKIEAEIRNVSGFGAAGKRRTLEAKKEAHIKTKPK